MNGVLYPVKRCKMLNKMDRVEVIFFAGDSSNRKNTDNSRETVSTKYFHHHTNQDIEEGW